MKKLKKRISVLVAMAAFCGVATTSVAVTNGVTYTVHNLGSTSMASVKTDETSQVCVFCHTPHNAVGSGKFLWNRNATAISFALYTASPTLNFDKGVVTISEVSKMCMSCHDGVTAMNSMANPVPNIAPGFTNTLDVYAGGPNIGEGDSGTGGGNLTNDHPISFTYADSISGGDTTLFASGDGGKTVGGLPLWEGKVECVTCHDPHINYGYPAGNNTLPGDIGYMGGDTALKPFLRKSNASSSLCFTCHNK